MSCKVNISRKVFRQDTPGHEAEYVAFAVENKGEVPIIFMDEVYLPGDFEEFRAICDRTYDIKSDVKFVKDGQITLTEKQAVTVNYSGVKKFTITEVKAQG